MKYLLKRRARRCYTKFSDNKLFKRWKISTEEVTGEELAKDRRVAIDLMRKDITKIKYRQCWNCHPEHWYFLYGPWGEWVLNCPDCGHFYFNKTDITYEP
jgi:hypothetical protein